MPPQQLPQAETRSYGNLQSSQSPEGSVQQFDNASGLAQSSTESKMSPEMSEQPQTHVPEDIRGDQDRELEQDDGRLPNRALTLQHVRDVVRLFQCRHCSKPLNNAITLPCGRSICRTCIPETHLRTSITYPAVPDRLQGFVCPFDECSKVHALSDCALDVVLNKVAEITREGISHSEAAALASHISTEIGFKDPWGVAGIPSMQHNDSGPRVIQGAHLVATWTLATEGGLAVEADLSYTNIAPEGESVDKGLALDTGALTALQSATRSEVDCQVCYALFHDPLTTHCGHTFCRSCLHRTLDHSHRCPMCRRHLVINPLPNPTLSPSNECIARLIELFWPDEKAAREATIASDIAARHLDLDLPLFVCTLAFPSMPTFLHIFEPRYRLMMRRVLEGNKTFGMVLPKRPRDAHDANFHEMGTLLRITNAQFYPDGRSLIETVGLTRFKVLRHGELDGYTVAKTERVDDVSLEEEEAVEAAEAAAPSGNVTATVNNQSPTSDLNDSLDETPAEGKVEETPPPPTAEPTPLSISDLQAMSTQSLMGYATGFVARMREQSVPWLTARMLDIYGECPCDPAIFPWWFASMLPVKDLEKYRLLGTSSVRERLKLCCAWILEWETTRW